MVERTLNEEQKIRRAEEIYYRRKNLGNIREDYTTLNVDNKRNFGLLKKMILQIIACLFIYLIFFSIQNSNYIFSERFISKTKEILAYDINFEEIKNMVLYYYESLKHKDTEENNIIEQDSNITEDVDTQTSEDVLYKEEASSVSQVEEDATYIKNNYSLIKPLERNYNIKIWCKKSNNSNSSKVSHRNRYCSKYRDKNCCIYGRKCNTSIKRWRLWKPYANSKWRYYNSICTL